MTTRQEFVLAMALLPMPCWVNTDIHLHVGPRDCDFTYIVNTLTENNSLCAAYYKLDTKISRLTLNFVWFEQLLKVNVLTASVI